jgi:DNA-binding MarR family transcriptional regulator
VGVDRDRLGREAHINLRIASERFVADLEEVFKAHGVSHAQYSVLWVLVLSEGPVPMSAIADGLVTRGPDVTRLVDRLEAAGLVERKPSPGDRRVVLVAPTRKGRSLAAKLGPLVTAQHRRQWQHLSDAELETLAHLLVKAIHGGAT